MKQATSGLERLVLATGNSWRGIRACWRNEGSFRLEVVLALPLLALALLLPLDGAERALLMASVLLVVVVELLNSAIEAVVDRIGPEHHPLSGLAKDCASAAVGVCLLLAAVVWACVLLVS